MSDFDDDDQLVSLEDLEDEETQVAEKEDWGDQYDDMDADSWDSLYHSENEELEGDPWDLN